MKLNGVTVKIDRETIIPIVGKDISLYLIARPVQSYEEFDKLCPRPTPRVGGEPGKERPLTEAKDYQEALADVGKKFSEWVNITTLVEIASADAVRQPIEWSTVDLEDLSTYANWRTELKEENGFSDSDIRRIEMEVLRCNQMDEQMIEAAKDHFLAMERELQQ